jgi:uncharacterized membrane protein
MDPPKVQKILVRPKLEKSKSTKNFAEESYNDFKDDPRFTKTSSLIIHTGLAIFGIIVMIIFNVIPEIKVPFVGYFIGGACIMYGLYISVNGLVINYHIKTGYRKKIAKQQIVVDGILS